MQKIISNIGWLFFDKVLRMGVGLIVGIWVARYLGPSQFGVLNYAAALVVLVMPLASLGLDTIVTRDLVSTVEEKGEILGTTFVLKLMSGIATVLLAIVVIFALRPEDTLAHTLVIIIAAGAMFQSLDTIDFWFQSQIQSKYTVIARNLAFLLIALVKIGLLLFQAPLIAFAWAGLGESALGTLGLVIAYRATGQYFKIWKASWLRAKQLLKESWPLLLASIAIVVYMKIDQVMLGEIVGNEAVGIYSVAVRFSEIWYFIPMSIVSSVFPAVVQAKKTNESYYYQRLQQLFNLMTGISLAVAILMTFLSGALVTGLYGQDYAAASTILAIHIWASVFVFLGVGASPWFVTESLTVFSLQRTVIGAIINVILNLVLMPLYAGLGAAIATVIAYAFSGFLLNAVNRKTRPIFWLQAKSFLFLRSIFSANS